MRVIKYSWLFLVVSLGCSCSNQIRDEHLFLDLDWKRDIYNIVYTSFDNIDELKFWVIKKPQYLSGSAFQQGCIEILEPANQSKFYIVNINLYSLKETNNCNDFNKDNEQVLDLNVAKTKENELIDKTFDFLSKGNMQDSKDVSIAYSGDKPKGKKGIISLNVKKSIDGKLIHLVFSELFPVDQYQLTQDGQDILLEAMKTLSTLSIKEITIYGIADSSGNYLHNKKLSTMRAESVYQYILEQGLKNIPIKIKGSVENGENSALERALQRRFFIEVRLNNNEE